MKRVETSGVTGYVSEPKKQPAPQAVTLKSVSLTAPVAKNSPAASTAKKAK